MNDKIESEKKISFSGNSLIVKITKEARLMGLNAGDNVRVILEKI